MDLYIWTICLLAIFVLFYYWSVRNYDYWKKRNIPYVRPIPLFGNILPVVVNRENYPETLTRIYERLDGQPYGGYFELREPVLLIRDPELVSLVAVKDFEYFRDRRFEILFNPDDRNLNPLSSNLFVAEGDAWKNLRRKLSAGFTSSKLQNMSIDIEICTNFLMKSMQEKLSESRTIEIRELLMNYTIDVIGVCDFGLDCTSLAVDRKTEFVRMCRKAFGVDNRLFLKVLLLTIHPILLKVAKIPDIPVDVSRFFRMIISDAVARRKSTGESRNDFLQTLMDLKDDEGMFDDIDIASNVFMFFSAGFETTASIIMYCLYELAFCLKAQNNVREEILKKFHGQKLNIADVKELPYLDMVICESLRMHPPVGALLRVCTKEYRIPGTDNVLSVGTKLIIPVISIHNDPKIYPNPKLFDPERFSAENKLNIRNGSYLPFGEGPRNCIGTRFAQLVTKFALVEIIRNYSVEPCAKTERPIQFQKGTPLYVPENGVWLNFEKLNSRSHNDSSYQNRY